ncbi:MAG: DegV family EDD domain-containing protein [Agathobacter sp.]|nr:DegV family EDD domain-containing protein [Agathobacter sp.]
MIQKVWKLFTDDKLEIKERLFRIILVVGTIAVGLAIVQGLTLVNAYWLMPLYVLMFLAFISALVLTFKFHNIELSSTILGIVLIVFALPIIFLRGGGVNSGSGIWMCLGLFYVFIMFTGRKLLVFLAITLVMDIGSYVVSYLFPEQVVELATPFEKHFDSIFAVLIVGITVGVVMKFQLRVFDRERKTKEQQQEELEKLSKSKDAFFASMSHEIRTPINAIIGFNELILRENPSEEVQDYAKNIQNSSKMLLSLVNDILDLSQLEIHKMELLETEYRVSSMFHEVVDIIQGRLVEKELDFQVKIDEKIPMTLYGDERRIKQILLNLLTNAVKYTEAGTVTLSCEYEKVSEDRIRMVIAVADTGLGIRKEELEYLFDAFRRVNIEKNSKIEGTGLGLSIAKHLLDLMGGEITVDSIYTQGSEFRVMIEQKIVDERPMGEFSIASTGKKKKNYYSKSFEAPEARVLVVDDDDLSLVITSKLLQETRMTIDSANCVEECLKKTQKYSYDLILMDYMMPGMDGASLLKEIRKQEAGLCRNAEAVLLSANVLEEKKNEYLLLGFDGVLEKPIDAARLEQEVLRHIPSDMIEYRREDDLLAQGHYFVSRAMKKRKRIYVTSDGVCDLPAELLEKYDIRLIDLYIKTENGRFRDTKEIDVYNLSRYLSEENSSAFSLSPTVEDYEHFFADLLLEADDVIYYAMAKNAGRCFENAAEAAKGFSRVHIVDSSHISSGQGLLVLHAAKMASEGATVPQILKETESVKHRIHASFILPGTKILYQKGFTDKVTAKICDLFRLHPVLGSVNSKMTVLGVRAGRLERVWRKYIQYHLKNAVKTDDRIVFVVHAGCSVKQQEIILDEINRCMKFKQVIFTPASTASTCNSGLGSIGLAVYRRK